MSICRHSWFGHGDAGGGQAAAEGPSVHEGGRTLPQGKWQRQYASKGNSYWVGGMAIVAGQG